MKVNIGPYRDWIGPYQIADYIFFWIDRSGQWNDNYPYRWDQKLHEKFGKWLDSTWVHSFCVWVESKKKRRIKVKIHDYDVWSADHTLALIIHPVLLKLRENKHGAPRVDNDDVPKELRSTDDGTETDENFFKRWDYVLNEMIFAFEKLSSEWESEFFNMDNFKKSDDLNNLTVEFDLESMNNVRNRINNGLRLFAKYYHNLWD